MDNKLIIEAVEVGPFFTNCYVVGMPGGCAFIIDPGDEGVRLKELITKHRFKPSFIINTHGHIDHIKEDDSFNLPVYIHEEDASFLRDPDLNLSSFLGEPFKLNDNTRVITLKGKDSIEFNSQKIEIIHTPGHTPGGICIKFGQFLFSGDTLFCGSIGRTDFKGGSQDLLIEFIKNNLFPLDDDLTVLPGHGPKTALGQEKVNNPFLH